MMRELVMNCIEPVDNTLEVDPKRPAYPSEAHPFQAHLYSLCLEGRVVTHRFLVGCEVTLTTLTSQTFAACVIGACFDHSF
jgi:hypothetical protein